MPAGVFPGRMMIWCRDCGVKLPHFGQCRCEPCYRRLRDRKAAERRRRAGVRCRHCECKPATKARGLCGNCYNTPAVLALYPVAVDPDGPVPDRYGPRPLPVPTDALPGSAEKKAVLAARAEAGQG